MEIGLKERLIGAAVLVILGVIIIPFFLKGPSPDSGANQTVTLPPAAATAVQQYTLSLGAVSAVPPATAAHAPLAAPAARTAPAAPATHPIQRTPAATAPPAGAWLVQAGSYGSEANADKVATGLKTHGFHASISRFNKGGHSYYRVRVGPYADRAAAEHAAAAVAKASGAKTEVVPNS